MYFLEISTANDFTFFVVVMFYGTIALIAIGIIDAIFEIITSIIERRRRKKFRKGYVDLRNYED